MGLLAFKQENFLAPFNFDELCFNPKILDKVSQKKLAEEFSFAGSFGSAQIWKRGEERVCWNPLEDEEGLGVIILIYSVARRYA